MTALMQAGCGNVSRGVTKGGTSASQLVWPSSDNTTPMHKGGTFPLRAQLKAIRTGMNKRQIAYAIGYPHFDEGIWNVREWNYVFNFRDGDSDLITVCQFKILFDDNNFARSFYWKPDSCISWMNSPVPAVAKATPALKEQTPTLSTDALFIFAKSDLAGC